MPGAKGREDTSRVYGSRAMTGGAVKLRSVQIGGLTWDHYRHADDILVHVFPDGVTVGVRTGSIGAPNARSPHRSSRGSAFGSQSPKARCEAAMCRFVEMVCMTADHQCGSPWTTA